MKKRTKTFNKEKLESLQSYHDFWENEGIEEIDYDEWYEREREKKTDKHEGSNH